MKFHYELNGHINCNNYMYIEIKDNTFFHATYLLEACVIEQVRSLISGNNVCT